MRGAAGAPPRIREALWSASSNSWTETGVDLSAPGALDDAGDLELSDDAAEARAAIESGVASLLDRGVTPIVLGGDHSITYPVMRAFHRHLTGLTIVHFDAHGDLYDEFEGDRFSHACPFARIMEEGLAVRLVQIGILGTLTAHQREQVKKFGVEVYDATQWADAPVESVSAPLYLSIHLELTRPGVCSGGIASGAGGLSTLKSR